MLEKGCIENEWVNSSIVFDKVITKINTSNEFIGVDETKEELQKKIRQFMIDYSHTAVKIRK